jgi:hypothetical protein
VHLQPKVALVVADPSRGIAPYRLDQLDRLILGLRAPPTQGGANASATLKNPAENPAKTDPCQGGTFKVAAALS